MANQLRASGEEEAEKIRAEAERQRTVLLAEAYKKAQEIKGGADARATNIYASAYDQSADTRTFYQFLKTMETYGTVMDGQSSLVLSTDADVYRFLKGSQ